MVEGELILTVPLREIRKAERSRRASNTIYTIRKFVSKNMKVSIDKVWVDPKVNEKLWTRSIEKPPSKIQVKIVKFEEDESVEVLIPE
jgi:large subunit ribosomal protein L31e